MAHSIRSLASRQPASQESEPLYSALNTVNFFLGNAFIRKVIRGLYAEDKQAIYEALSLYSGQNDLNLMKKIKLLPICAFVELGRMSFTLISLRCKSSSVNKLRDEACPISL